MTGTAWTSHVERDGWHHFHVVGVSRREGAWVAELAASCDSSRRVSVDAADLLKHRGWDSGWTPLNLPTG